MKLADLRKLAIRKQLNIHFAIGNGMECVIGADGVARVPALRRAADFNLETELASATEFLIAPAVSGSKVQPAKRLTREELSAMAQASPAAAPHDREE
jgi:hypothetical protein